MQKRFGSLSSSVDPDKLALSVQGAIVLVAGTLVTFGVFTVQDQTTLLDSVNTIVAQIMIILPAATATYGAMQTIVGLGRKFVVYMEARLARK